MDIKPPKNWRQQHPQARNITPTAPTPSRPIEEPSIPVEPQLFTPVLLLPDEALSLPPRKRRRKLLIGMVIILGVLGALVAGSVVWYTSSLQPRDASAGLQLVTVEQGMTPRTIASLLETEGIIRSRLAFELYTTLNGHANSLQAGTYQLGASQSVADIVSHLIQGRNDVYNVTILPGMTLKQLADPTVKNSLAAQGFSEEDISAAFGAEYTSPLLADRPAGATLEGYIFPETYQLRTGDSLQSLIQRSLDEFYSRLQTDDLLKQFTARGLTLYQAVTLASIVQQEVGTASDQRQVAQVFLKRLSEGMMLGSDVTFIYAADQLGVAPSVTLDSPYNTRKYTGLPPGPIATMNFSALEAVAEPAAGDYLYFVAGDDGVTYFSRTFEEHEAAITAHCKVLCSQY